MQYRACKLDIFGIKLWLAVDVELKFTLNAMAYLGKDKLQPLPQKLTHNFIPKFPASYVEKERSITTDNFTSIKLSGESKKKKNMIPRKVNKTISYEKQ